MLRIKIIFPLIVGFFIVSETESFLHGHKIVAQSAYFIAGNVFAQNQEPMDFEDINGDEIDDEQILEEGEIADLEEISGEEVPEEELIQEEMVEEEVGLHQGNEGYVYYVSSAEQKLEKEKKEGTSPWKLIKKLDDWIKQNLW